MSLRGNLRAFLLFSTNAQEQFKVQNIVKDKEEDAFADRSSVLCSRDCESDFYCALDVHKEVRLIDGSSYDSV